MNIEPKPNTATAMVINSGQTDLRPSTVSMVVVLLMRNNVVDPVKFRAVAG
jgi:hypothetical protein